MIVQIRNEMTRRPVVQITSNGRLCFEEEDENDTSFQNIRVQEQPGIRSQVPDRGILNCDISDRPRERVSFGTEVLLVLAPA
jgi:hypothetical protein